MVIFFISLSLRNMEEINHYLLYLIKIVFFFLIWLAVVKDLEFKKLLQKSFIFFACFLAIMSILGFTLVNGGFVTVQEEVSLYGLFGMPDEENGYFYAYNPYLGFFAKTSLLNLEIKRVVGITFEPNSTGVVIMLALLILYGNDGLFLNKRLLSLILFAGGICTVSLLFLASAAIFVYLILLKRVSKISIKLLFTLMLLIFLMIFGAAFILEVARTSSGFIRVMNFIFLFDFYVSEFSFWDVMLGRGLGFSKTELGFGIDSGYLELITELGILSFLGALCLVWSLLRNTAYALPMVLIQPLFVNLHSSFTFLLCIALLSSFREIQRPIRSNLPASV